MVPSKMTALLMNLRNSFSFLNKNFRFYFIKQAAKAYCPLKQRVNILKQID